MAKIGRNIREQRMKKGLSQEELAARLYVTRQTISNYETGRSNPDVEMLTRLAEALDTDIQLFIYGEPKKRNVKEIRRAAARLAVILLLYVISQVIAGYEEDAARTTYMMPCISLFMRLTGYPVLFLWTGSTVTSLIMAVTGGKSTFLARKSVVHRTVLVPFAGCLFFMAPYSLSFIAMKIWAWADVLLYPEKTMRSYGFNFGPVLGHIYFHMMDFIFTYSSGIYMICFVAGCVLWLTKTEKKK
ncbi:helix-turn-helix domain-containing protein [Faecalicatena fissicatena]|uniref:Helix-turn-helix transcriptional regulator n=1 Tax=Faecalicatena fissicatena TaxID=290055 RepID=A0ABS2EB07_9FIRM|nr:helix-turn-helix transcriptional regulator [Faecalicatena fissicatena]MBM6738823.1 helix-turn-helix transcriptional regulator [Faecalicatena fissicatena]